MKRRSFLFCSFAGALALAGVPLQAAAASSFTQQTFSASGGECLRYWLYIPENAVNNMPLVVYLHGGSGKGDELSLVTEAESLPRFLQDGRLAPSCYVIAPQLPKTCRSWAEKKDALLELIDSVCRQYPIDPARVSLTGHSMGGTGTWELALACPERFSAAAPLSGSVQTMPANIQKLGSLPIWAVVGGADTIVDPASSERFIQILSHSNPNCRITVLDGTDHFSVPAAYLDESLDIPGWLTAQSQ